MQVYSQDGWVGISRASFKQDLNKISDASRQENIQLSFEKKVYNDVSLTLPSSSDKGIFYRGLNADYRSESGSIITVQANKLKVSIDTSQKVIVASKTDTLFENIDFATSISSFLDQVDTIYVKKGVEKTYQILISESNPNFSAMEITITNKTYAMKKVSLIYKSANYISDQIDDETIEQPKIELIYGKPENIKQPSTLLNWDQWIQIDRQGTLSLQPKFANYELIDTRVERN